MQTTVGEFLFTRLRQAGVSDVIGVPGDFNLNLLEQLEGMDGIRFVGACNELNAAYAADGYARRRGIGALLTTYGVGELSALVASPARTPNTYRSSRSAARHRCSRPRTDSGSTTRWRTATSTTCF